MTMRSMSVLALIYLKASIRTKEDTGDDAGTPTDIDIEVLGKQRQRGTIHQIDPPSKEHLWKSLSTCSRTMSQVDSPTKGRKDFLRSIQHRSSTPLPQKFTRKAIANNVIRSSQAEAWSQILLFPKADESWRSCFNFRPLKTATKAYGWLVSNIWYNALKVRKPRGSLSSPVTYKQELSPP